jgi:uncharacterized protein YbcI
MHESVRAVIANERETRPNDELARVCRELASVFRRAWGRGPVRTTAHWAGPDILVVVHEDGHSDAERTLRTAGHARELLDGRRLLQAIVEEELKSTVERIVARPVRTVLSATRLNPDLSAEVFLLARPARRD